MFAAVRAANSRAAITAGMSLVGMYRSFLVFFKFFYYKFSFCIFFVHVVYYVYNWYNGEGEEFRRLCGVGFCGVSLGELGGGMGRLVAASRGLAQGV